MKLFSQTAELKAIKSITAGAKMEAVSSKILRPGSKLELNALNVHSKIDSSSYLLASLDPSYFHYDPCKAAYERIVTIAKKRATILSYTDLLEDLSLNEEFRDILSEYNKRPVASLTEAISLMDTLGKYRKARILYFSAKNILEHLKSNEIDVDMILDETANRITEARTQTLDKDPILTIGKDANALDLIDDALSTEDDLLLKTGFIEFDNRSGGLPAEGVMLIAATTGGGKSTLRMNLLRNMYKLNKIDTITVSFEMNPRKETRRFLSSLSSVPLWKFNNKALTPEDRSNCKDAWKKFHRFGKKYDCRYSIMCPTRGLTIQQVLMLLKPYSFKVICIDYVSLLDGVDEDNQARMLKSIVRECKLFSGSNKCLIILLAQLDEAAGHIRYSRGMLEDADACWQWNYTGAEDRDRNRLPIKQKKARDGELFDFELEENFKCMQVLNTEESISAAAEGYTPRKLKEKGDDSDQIDPLDDSGVAYAVD
jgi:replicative DNA helicase